MTRIFVIAASFAFIFGCSGDDSSTGGGADAANLSSKNNEGDSGSTVDADGSGDAATPGDSGSADSGSDAAQPGDAGGDSGSNADDAGADAEADTGGGDPYAGRPIGQCTVSDDCPENPNGKTCNRSLPGGACSACGNDTVCDDICLVGTCVTTCSDTDDCPPGLRCGGTGRCIAVACVQGVCPIPLFGCTSSGNCARVDCSNGAACPTNTTCVSGVCIEDRAL